MFIIEIIYIGFIGLAIAACIPQLTKLVKTKTSDGFAARSWLVWLGAQLATLAYVISIQAYLMAAVNVAWVGFYAAMAVLILYYRRYPGGRMHEAVLVPLDET